MVGGAVGLAARAAGVEPVRVTTNSMAPAVTQGDWIVVRSLSPQGRHGLRRGDIVQFRYPFGSTGRAIKRVIAVAGDTVAYTEHDITVNGRTAPISGSPGTGAGRRQPLGTIPAGRVFLLGDNAKVSIDSRIFGAVPATELVGRETLVIGKPQTLLLPALAAGLILGLSVLLLRRRPRQDTSSPTALTH